ncbi:MAG: radical SAM protein [Candidatus Parcubacteria bacterium]|nr:radical SAM protein [Candidatus Parcubacteria bacterium]
MVTIIAKIVGNFCNLKCSYCFYRGTDQTIDAVMSLNLLDKLIKDVLDFPEKTALFIWHGGEPLLAGLDFFEEIIKLQNKYNRSNMVIKNSIQTNATLINDDWAQFFKSHKFRVGVSLDGCEETHNKFRKYSNGKGSFNNTIRGIKTLRSHEVPLGFIQTISKKNLVSIQKDFHFFVDDLNINNWGINPIFDIYEKNNILSAEYLEPQELTYFLKTLIGLWIARNDKNLSIREIDNFVAGVLGKRAKLCIFNGTCSSYLCVDFNGNVYPCDRFSCSEEFRLGDIGKESIKEIFRRNKHYDYKKAITDYPTSCLKCSWFNACHNGCSQHRIGGLSGEYYYCATRREIFSFLREKIKSIKKGGK